MISLIGQVPLCSGRPVYVGDGMRLDDLSPSTCKVCDNIPKEEVRHEKTYEVYMVQFYSSSTMKKDLLLTQLNA